MDLICTFAKVGLKLTFNWLSLPKEIINLEYHPITKSFQEALWLPCFGLTFMDFLFFFKVK